MPMVVGLAVTMVAHAAPRFVGNPYDVHLAEVAWDGARACTGRDGAAADEVEIVRKTVPLDYLGVARTDPSGRLYRIDLNSDPVRLPEVVVHEVSHAWVSDGPVALVEGTAQLIADCIVDHNPGLAPLQYDNGSDLAGLPDLLTWAKPTDDAPSELHAVRTDGYVGAARLIRTAMLAVDPAALWSDRDLEWADFDAALTTSERGRELLAALSGGPDAQRAALQDQDRDGLTAIAESWLGTSDLTFDSDGDGWGDAAVLGVPAGAVAAPLDATPVCARLVAGPDDAPVVVRSGNLRGVGVPGLVVRRADGAGPRPVLVRLEASPGTETTGSTWVMPGGPRSDLGCRSTARVTVWSDDPAFDGVVDQVAAALTAATAVADQRFGDPGLRVALALGGPHTRVDDGVIRWSSGDVAAAAARGDLDHLARVSVAVGRLWLDGDRDWSAAEAVARSLVPDPPGTPSSSVR